ARRSGQAAVVRRRRSGAGRQLAHRGGHRGPGGRRLRRAAADRAAGGRAVNARLKRLAPVATAGVVVLLSLAALVASPGGAAVPGSTRADYVVVAGAPGLRWDGISPQTTPALWQLAQHGSIGALSVTSARRTTCAADGWVTLGAGNLAE